MVEVIYYRWIGVEDSYSPYPHITFMNGDDLQTR